ncbi:MAG: lysophospholipid acyltransferase family protein [Propionibacteriaceae bacterium]|nr:lysophospholipid acyltransferase family protein [Propionibacteriaceae bacterium]
MHEMTPAQTADKPWRLPLRKVNKEKAPWVYRSLVRAVRVFAPLLTRRHWSRQDLIPADGGVLVVANHISNYDVLVLGEFLIWSGRWPRFLGKSEIFKTPVLGWVARQCGQIPVLRNTTNAKQSLVYARKALEDGLMVSVYPEGTITKDPDGWPMSARRGAAQLALTTGVPVIPVGQIGAELVLGGGTIDWSKLFSLRRRPVHVLAGEPVDLDRFRTGEEPTLRELDLATTAIMDAVVALVEQLRGEKAPEGRWDTRKKARVSVPR